MKQTVLISGGTGLVGKRLTEHLLVAGFEVIILSRHKKESLTKGVTYAVWNIQEQFVDENAISRADFIIHLAGAGVMEKKWTASYKKEIIESRTKSSELLIKGLFQFTNKVQAVISASAIGYYGTDKKLSRHLEGFRETDPPNNDFLGETCRLWEESIEPVKDLGKRLVRLRIGIVLSNEGGAFPEFKKSLSFGIASILGSGKQVVSWIHIDDLCRLFIFAISNPSIYGNFNAVAPNPISNKKLIVKLANKVKGKFYIALHIPAFMLKLMLGQRSIEILKSTTVDSYKVREQGFSFGLSSIDAALTNLIE